MKAGTRLERILEGKLFAVTAEIAPPKGVDAKRIIAATKTLSSVADAVNLTDNQLAICRMSSLAASKIILDQGVEPVMQLTCRDRNRLALQSDVLGAVALGIKNIFCLTGDRPHLGNHPEAKAVFDLKGLELIECVRKLRDEGKFWNNEPFKTEPPKLYIGCASNPFGGTPKASVDYLERKADAGADFAQTQPVFDLEKFDEWMAVVRSRGLHQRLHILVGAMPVKSMKSLNYLSEVPGIVVPAEMKKRFAEFSETEVKKEGVQDCARIVQHLRKAPGVAGVHIMSVAWEEAIPEIVNLAGLLPRPKTQFQAA